MCVFNRVQHLGAAYKPSYDDNNVKLFSAFRKMAQLNLQALRDGRLLVGRVVAMTPLANYELLLRNVLYPTALQKLSAKLGFAPTESEQHAAPLKTPKAAL